MSNFNRITLTSTKDPQNTEIYPTIFVSDLIYSNLPQKIEVEQRVLVESPREPEGSITPDSKPFMLSNRSATFSILFCISTLVLAGRFFNLYRHDGVTIAAAVTALISLIWSIRLIRKEKAAYLHKLAEVSLQHHLKLSAPEYKTILVEKVHYPDWKVILIGKIKSPDGISDANKGVSEKKFKTYLEKYFRSSLKPSYSFKNPNYHIPYSADFCIQLSCGLSIDIEIDEPYDGKTKIPHHCTNIGDDKNRDLFFTERNWIAMRFSEKQVVIQPDECCYYIAALIAALTGDTTFKNKFGRSVTAPDPDPRWTTSEAAKMAENDYRNTYLPKYIPKRKKSQPPASNHSKPTSKERVNSKPILRKKKD